METKLKGKEEEIKKAEQELSGLNQEKLEKEKKMEKILNDRKEK